MSEFTATWRFTVIVLAVACFGNSTVMFGSDSLPLQRVIGMLSAMAGPSLIASLRFSIRKITLVFAAVAMWLQVYVTLRDATEVVQAIRGGVVFFAFGLLAFGAWINAMRGCWPSLNRIWRVALI